MLCNVARFLFCGLLLRHTKLIFLIKQMQTIYLTYEIIINTWLNVLFHSSFPSLRFKYSQIFSKENAISLTTKRENKNLYKELPYYKQTFKTQAKSGACIIFDTTRTNSEPINLTIKFVFDGAI